MSISFQCPQCASKFNVAANLAGKKAKCKCGNVIVVPSVHAVPAPAPVSAPSPSAILVQCPSCGQQHQASAAMAGTMARCGCGAVLQIPHLNPAAAAPQPAAPFQAPAVPAQPAFQQPAAYQQPAYPAAPDPFAAPQPYGQQPFQQQPASHDPLLDDLAAGEMMSQAVYQPYPQQQMQQPAAPVSNQQSEDALLNQYLHDEDWKKPDPNDGDGGSLESGMMNAGFLGGLFLFVGGIVVFGALWISGWIWPYALVISALGLVSMLKELFT